MNKKVTFITSIFLVSLILYVGSYFFIKYKYFAIAKPNSYFSSIFNRADRVTAVAFYDRNKIEVFFYYIYLPIGKIEKSFNDTYIYELVGFEILRS